MTENVMLEVSDEIAAALSMGGRLCDSYKRQKRRNGECSLDAQEQNIALANFRRKKLSQTGIRGNNGNIKYLTFDEASYLAKVSRSMINKWANKGKFSVAYKLKLNGGDIKAVQGDSGHAQVNMVTDEYSYILDDDRRKNAELFEEAFYEKKNLDPQMHVQQENNNATVADEVDPELLAKVLANPEMRALLNSLAKTMK